MLTDMLHDTCANEIQQLSRYNPGYHSRCVLAVPRKFKSNTIAPIIGCSCPFFTDFGPISDPHLVGTRRPEHPKTQLNKHPAGGN